MNDSVFVLHPKVENETNGASSVEGTKQSRNSPKHLKKLWQQAPTKFTWLFIAFAFVLFIVWATSAPIDRGVVVDGVVVVEGKRKLLQHPDGGSVAAVLVKSGSWVKQGQALIQIDETLLLSDFDATQIQYESELAKNTRLKEELKARDEQSETLLFDTVALSKDLRHTHQGLSDIERNEIFLYQQRKAKQTAEDTILAQQQTNDLRQAAGWVAVSEGHQQRIKLFEKRIKDLQTLNVDGYSARHDIDNLTTQLAEVIAEYETAKVRIISFQASAAKAGVQRRLLQAEFYEEVARQLTESNTQLSERERMLVDAKTRLDRSIIRAPVDGQIVALNVFTSGQVIRPAEDILEIVPSSQALLVEGQVPVDLIDSVNAGMDVDLLFTAFNLSQTPKVSGKVVSLATDRQLDDKTGEPFYQASIRIDEAADKHLAHLELQPGMPVQAFVRNGSRSMFSYLMKPLFDRIPQAMAAD